jgi:signal transduction histidine kinase/ActR/RegA family two-component response regulator
VSDGTAPPSGRARPAAALLALPLFVAAPLAFAAGWHPGAAAALARAPALAALAFAAHRSQARLREAGAALAQKSHVLEVTLDSLSQGVLSLDAQGRTNAYNRRLLELLELPDELMRRRPTLAELTQWQMTHGHLGPGLSAVSPPGREGLERFLAGDRHAIAERYTRVRPDGMVLEVRSRVAADGSVVRTFTDITESVKAEQGLIAARDEAERANRAKSDFLSRMSHELRTPLNAILGFGQLLETDRGDPLSPAQRERVGRMLRGGEHLLALINEVLDLARIESGTLDVRAEAVDLDALFADAVARVTPTAAGRGVAITRDAVPPAARHVLADAMRLRQVLLNLLSNAIKYNRPGGRVALHAEADGGGVRLVVADDGPGIPAEQQPRLFRAFERLDAGRSAVEGAGIGLALSKWLVELMHGTIGVDSAPGRGSRFWVRLPRAEAPCTARRVLYIEDNAVNQALMQGMLGHRPGIRLQMADEPAEGLAAATAEPPDLVLLDIQLPGMDGFEVLRRLRADPVTRQVPVAAVSANAMPADLARAREAGFDDYLTKPIDFDRLRALLQRFAPPAAG